jgi:hypothetical protein
LVEPVPKVAVNDMGYVPAVSGLAAPAIVAVPLANLVKINPFGKVPVSVIVGVGVPIVVTRNKNGIGCFLAEAVATFELTMVIGTESSTAPMSQADP